MPSKALLEQAKPIIVFDLSPYGNFLGVNKVYYGIWESKKLLHFLKGSLTTYSDATVIFAIIINTRGQMTNCPL